MPKKDFLDLLGRGADLTDIPVSAIDFIRKFAGDGAPDELPLNEFESNNFVEDLEAVIDTGGPDVSEDDAP